MSHFLRSNNIYRVYPEDSLDISKELPAANYLIKEDPYENLYLETVEPFVLPPKLYGSTVKYADRILNTYRDRDLSTGVMLSGEKGSGKTLLSKTISTLAKTLGYPTIIITNPFHDDRFSSLLQAIHQPCVILFDEFEKVYGKPENQEAILTILDGVFPMKKLFILTCNDKYKVNTHMRNRPGRIFYAIDYTGLEDSFIREYCNDNLNDKSHIDQVCVYAKLFSEFNFDMLKALVEDMNRYNEGPKEALELLNAKPENETNSIREYEPSMAKWSSESELRPVTLEEKTIRANPFSQNYIQLSYYNTPADEKEDNSTYCAFSYHNLTNIDSDTGNIVYTKDNLVLTLKPVKKDFWNYRKVF